MFFRRPTHWHIIDGNGAIIAFVVNPDPAAARPRTPDARDWPWGCRVVPVYARPRDVVRMTGYAS